jgi:hypothetical protein
MSHHDRRAPGASAPLAPWAKLLISALIGLHVTAAFVAPFAFASNVGPQASPFADAAYRALRPYIDALFLDHGYFFFAPNPGPNHLVEYTVEFDDGRPPVKGRFPDLAVHRPRLLYHRHFMLAEALTGRFVPPEPPPEPSPPPLTASQTERALYQSMRAEYARQFAAWQRGRKVYDAMRRSIEEHLKAKYGGSRATLVRIEHRLLSADEVELAGARLDAPETYVPLPETPPGNGR